MTLPWRKSDQLGGKFLSLFTVVIKYLVVNIKPLLLRPVKDEGMQWLCPVRAIGAYLNFVDTQIDVDTLNDEPLFGVIQKQTNILSFDKPMSDQCFMDNLHRAIGALDDGIIVSFYSLHCFRRGGIQFLDRMNWPIQKIIAWVGWSERSGCEINKTLVLKYLINSREDQFSDICKMGDGFEMNTDHWPTHYKNELMDL
jgi:hypothetical protein